MSTTSIFRLLAVVVSIVIAQLLGHALASDDSAAKGLPECLKKLHHATSFDDQVAGESGPRPNFLAYAQAREKIAGIEIADLEWLQARASPAGRLYSALLMKESGKVSDEQAFGRLLKDGAKVEYFSGCKGMETTVGEVADRFLKEGHFMNFRPSIFCKLKASPK